MVSSVNELRKLEEALAESYRAFTPHAGGRLELAIRTTGVVR
jgi:hypothetical protein